MVKQYVGARYVPKFASPVEWAPSTSYEALTIVTFNNASYTSKVPVPPTVGNPANNPQYWALTGNYNAQVEQYRQEAVGYKTEVEGYKQETEQYKTQLDEYKQETEKIVEEYTSNKHIETFESFGAVGDGTTDDTNAIVKAIAYSKTNHIPITSKGGTYVISGDLEISGATLINFGTIKGTGTITIDDSFIFNGNTYGINVICGSYGSHIDGLNINHFNGTGLTIKILTKVSGGSYRRTAFINILINDYDVSTGTIGIDIQSPDVTLENCEVINTIIGYKFSDGNNKAIACGCWINANIKKATGWENNKAFNIVGTNITLIGCTSDSYYNPIYSERANAVNLLGFTVINNNVIFNNFTMQIVNGHTEFIRGDITVKATGFANNNIIVKTKQIKGTQSIIDGDFNEPLFETENIYNVATCDNGTLTYLIDVSHAVKCFRFSIYRPTAGTNINITFNCAPGSSKAIYMNAICYKADGTTTLLPATLTANNLKITGTKITENSTVELNIAI